VVLSDDPFERPGKINNMRVEAMFFDGRLLAVKDRGAPLKPSGRS
jgi:hypothetical protein